jgi:hypothetical protein
VSGVPIVVHRNDRQDSRRRQLLEVHELRRSLERDAVADEAVRGARMELTRTRLVGELIELIAALDRRVPHLERANETSIARDAAALKARALKRIAELEHQPTSVRSQEPAATASSHQAEPSNGPAGLDR